jgi:hypothetical protein
MKLRVSFDEIDSSLDMKFIQTECTFNTDFGEVILVKTDDVYEGDYNVIPRVYQQILETKDKVMLDDVTVEIIPLQKVLNQSNGYTVTIG